MIDLRLRAYAPNGAALGLLPDALDLQVGLPLADVSSLTVSYSRRVAGGTVLERDLGQGLELAVEYTTGGAWTEPRNGRFLYLKRSFDLVDDTDTVRATCPGYAWQLRKARLEHKAGVAPVDGKRPFLSATTGGILATLLAEAKARGEITGFTTTATSTHDSAGQPWAQVITIYYEPGLTCGPSWTTSLSRACATGRCRAASCSSTTLTPRSPSTAPRAPTRRPCAWGATSRTRPRTSRSRTSSPAPCCAGTTGCSSSRTTRARPSRGVCGPARSPRVASRTRAPLARSRRPTSPAALACAASTRASSSPPARPHP